MTRTLSGDPISAFQAERLAALRERDRLLERIVKRGLRARWNAILEAAEYFDGEVEIEVGAMRRLLGQVEKCAECGKGPEARVHVDWQTRLDYHGFVR